MDEARVEEVLLRREFYHYCDQLSGIYVNEDGDDVEYGVAFSAIEKLVLSRYGWWLMGLQLGWIKPCTEAQERFVSVFNGLGGAGDTNLGSKEFEAIWYKYKWAVKDHLPMEPVSYHMYLEDVRYVEALVTGDVDTACYMAGESYEAREDATRYYGEPALYFREFERDLDGDLDSETEDT